MDIPFSIGEADYPASWLRLAKSEDRDALGISWKKVEEPPVVRAPLDREKSDGIARAKDTAGKMLAQSDWMVIASVERSRVVAEDWSEYRAAVIAEAERLEQEFNAAATYTDLDLIKQLWPLDPNVKSEPWRVEAEEAASKKEQEEAAAKAKLEEREDA